MHRQELARLLERSRDGTLTAEEAERLRHEVQNRPEAKRWWQAASATDEYIAQELEHLLQNAYLSAETYGKVESQLRRSPVPRRLQQSLAVAAMALLLLLGGYSVAAFSNDRKAPTGTAADPTPRRTPPPNATTTPNVMSSPALPEEVTPLPFSLARCTPVRKDMRRQGLHLRASFQQPRAVRLELAGFEASEQITYAVSLETTNGSSFTQHTESPRQTDAEGSYAEEIELPPDIQLTLDWGALRVGHKDGVACRQVTFPNSPPGSGAPTRTPLTQEEQLTATAAAENTQGDSIPGTPTPTPPARP